MTNGRLFWVGKTYNIQNVNFVPNIDGRGTNGYRFVFAEDTRRLKEVLVSPTQTGIELTTDLAEVHVTVPKDAAGGGTSSASATTSLGMMVPTSTSATTTSLGMMVPRPQGTTSPPRIAPDFVGTVDIPTGKSEDGTVHYVISNHASTSPNVIGLPHFLTVQFYAAIGDSLSCEKQLQSEICNDTNKVRTNAKSDRTFRYLPNASMNDLDLQPDIGSFKSGIVDCSRRVYFMKGGVQKSSNVIVVNTTINDTLDQITIRPNREITGVQNKTINASLVPLSSLLHILELYHAQFHRGTRAVLHVLTCRNYPTPSGWQVNVNGLIIPTTVVSSSTSWFGGRRKTRRAKGGIPRDVAKALHEAEQTGMEDAKTSRFKGRHVAPPYLVNRSTSPIINRYPHVSEDRIREAYQKGFRETGFPTGSSRRKTRRVRRNFL